MFSRMGWHPDRRNESDGGAPQSLSKVAFLVMESSPVQGPSDDPAGGIYVYVPSVAREFVRAGVAVDIYTRATSADLPSIQELEPGVRLIHVPVGPAVSVPKTQLAPFVDEFAAAVAHLGRRYGPYQMVSSHWWLSGLAALQLRRQWRVPIEFRSHSLALERNDALLVDSTLWSPERTQAERRIIAEADLLIAASISERDDFIRRYGARPERVRIVACGVDHEVFHPGDQQWSRDRIAGLMNAKYLLAYVGRLDTIKGLDLAVDALAALLEERPDLDVELLVVGGSGDKARHRQEITGLRNKVNWQGTNDLVHFRPSCPHKELPTIYQAATMVLVPSRSETFGLVALEAQACGTPVVATRVGSLPEIIRDGITGQLIADRDARRWAEVLAEILDNPTRLRAMRDAATAHAKGFSWRATATGLLAAYHEAISRYATEMSGPPPAVGEG